MPTQAFRPVIASNVMKTTLIFLFAISLGAMAQTPENHRFEVETGVSTLSLPTPYRTGWHVRQQITGYLQPRLGIALGVSWGASANNDPLHTTDPANPGPYAQPDPAQLRDFYTRQEHMTDLSLVVLPVLTKRHQLKAQVGLSVYRQREIRVDSIFRIDPRLPDYQTTGKLTNTSRVVPMAALGYDYRISSRWGIGINGVAYFTGDGRPTTTLGLRGTYRFGLSADSLGMKPIEWNELRAGVRLGAGFVAENSTGPGASYRTRFVGGFWAELPLSLTWAVRGEINYAQRGYQYDEVITGPVRRLSSFANLNYLEIPLMFRHEVAYRWHLYTGPYIAFFVNGYTETEGIRNPPVKPNSVTGIMVGTSYAITDRLSADLRYQRDLIQISSTPYGGLHSFQLALGWAFRKH